MTGRRSLRFIYVLFVLLSVWTKLIDGAGRVEINIFSLSNKCGRLADGSVCKNAALKSNDSASCPGLCNVIANVCLQPYPSADNVANFVPDTSWCPYGNGSSSGVVLGSNSFDISDTNNDNRGLISVPFTFSWLGLVTVILEFKHRDFTTGKDYLIARSVKPLNVNASKKSNFEKVDERVNLPGVNDEIRFSYGYRVLCGQNSYGPQCSKSCTSRNDNQSGHYECDDDGNRRCLTGYKNEATNCIEAVCSPDCKGTCKTPGGCDCPYGWYGHQCDKCVRYEGCMHGSCTKPFECICEPRWGGFQCHIDMDYCYHKLPCRNGATCIPHAPDNYTCICEAGFAGRDCEIELNPCWSNPCLNFGTCVLTSRNNYQCLCDQLHSGFRCEKLLAGKGDADPCFYDGQVFSHDMRWDTTDCRKCHCIDGFSNCSQPMCQSGDCLSSDFLHFDSSLSTVRCPPNQVCRSVTPDVWTCLKWPCTQRNFGQCVPVELMQDDLSDVKNRDKCQKTTSTEQQHQPTAIIKRVEDDLEFCSRFYVALRPDLIPVGTYPENICFHILLLLLKQQWNHYNVFCTLDRPNLTLIVDVVSVKDKWTVNGLKPYLMDILKVNSSADPYLRAISRVFDDVQTHTKGVDEKINHESQNEQNFHWLLIYVLPCVVILTIILLIIVLFLKYRHFCSSSSSNVDNKNNNSHEKTWSFYKTGNNNDCEMRWNNLSVSCSSIISNSILCKSNNNNNSSSTKQCNLYHKNVDKNVNCVDNKWTIVDDERKKKRRPSSSSSLCSSNENDYVVKKDVYVLEATV